MKLLKYIFFFLLLSISVKSADFGSIITNQIYGRFIYANILSEECLNYWSTNVLNGDTIIFPSGTIQVTNRQTASASVYASTIWTNSVTIFFKEPAIITNKISVTPNVQNYVFRFQGPSNSVSRISGVTIDGSSTGAGISVGAEQNVRIDHCNFRYIYGDATVYWGTRAYGIVDHCSYLNCRVVHETLGGDVSSWTDPVGIATGGTNCVVFENNTITFSDDNWVSQDECFYNGQGAKLINRFNTLTSTVTGTNVWYFDCHGNQEAVPGGNSRGTIYAILQGNVVNIAKSPLAGGIRGGQLIMISNIVNVTSGDPHFRLTDEEGWQTAYFPTLTSNWPVADQITNSYFIGNQFNGSETTESIITNLFINYTNEVHLIKLNRDYWITNGMPPSSKYVPLQYPHPLVNNGKTVILSQSPSFVDVSNSVSVAKNGDIVIIPPGTATWTNTLIITNGITLFGMGTNNTIITNSIPMWGIYNDISDLPPLIEISLVEESSIRISGIWFQCNWTNGGQGIILNHSRTSPRNNFRIDHCRFDRAYSRAIKNYNSYGVVDHCVFIDNRKNGIDTYRSDSAEWNRLTAPYYNLGTTNTTVVEDCFISWTSWMPSGTGSIMSSDWGGHYVVRNCIITNSISGLGLDGLDAHGNVRSLTGNTNTDIRGTIFFECYNNIITLASDSYRSMALRGGTLLVYSNRFFGSPGTMDFMLNEEEAYTNSLFTGESPDRIVDSSFPASDQITNSYFWNNTLNLTNSIIPYIYDSGLSPNPTTNFIKVGRDYFLHSPYYPNRSTNANGTVNVLSNYTPLIYPHPRVTSESIIIANSPSFIDVSNAVEMSYSGYIIRIPSGTAVWTNTLTITKPIHLIGSGTNLTIISNNIPRTGDYSDGWRPPLLNFQIVTNGDVRVSRIKFLLGTNQGIFFNQNAVSGDPPLYSHRVDNCSFDRAYTYAIWYNGIVDGVVDHCLFLDPRIGIGRNGLDSSDWNRFSPPLWGLGTTNTLVVENCNFVWTTNAPASQPIDCGQGSHYVFRYNNLNYTDANTTNSHDGLDVHGNNHLESVDGWRGTIFSEIYNNTFIWSNNGFRLVKVRGGTTMIFSNIITKGSSSYGHEIVLDEEEMWANYVYDYPSYNLVRTNPPAQDQITNSFIWGNVVNGVSSNLVVLYGANPDLNPVTSNTVINPVSLTIEQNKDYWIQSPKQQGYTNRSGGVNVMANYTPLIYPHPRVTSESIIIANSPSFTDVSNAVQLANIGDTVRIPAGGATWNNYLLIQKGINLIGAGTNSTFITNSIPPFSPYSTGVPLIVVALTDDYPVRISSLYIYGGWTNGGSGILLDNGRSFWPGNAPTKVSSYRIDRVVFDYCYPRAFKVAGRYYGVVDHCLFLNNYVGHSVDGENSTSWSLFSPPLWSMGTTNTRVIESSVFSYTKDLGTSPVPCDAGDGGDYVFRFNTITNTQTSHYIDGLDAHGNNRMLSYEDKRGTIFIEIYNNTINNNRGLKFCKIRGGTLMAFSNVFNVSENYAYTIQLDEEETWATYVYDQPNLVLVRTNPPAQDQITNSFIWNNILNANSLSNEPSFYDADPDYNPITIGTTNNPIALVLEENKDFWRKSPWSTPYVNRSGSTNIMTNYIPLVYPHPRVTLEDYTNIVYTTTTNRIILFRIGSMRRAIRQ